MRIHGVQREPRALWSIPGLSTSELENTTDSDGPEKLFTDSALSFESEEVEGEGEPSTRGY